MTAERRVVITGLGMLTPLGLSVQESWTALLAGESGIRPLEGLPEDMPVRFAGTVSSDFDPAQYFPLKEIKKSDRFIHYGMAAAFEALNDSGLVLENEDLTRVGVAVGSGIGGLPMLDQCSRVLHEQGPKRMSPFFIPGVIVNMLSGQISMRFGFRGPNIAIVSACTTGTHNIGYAARTIQCGDADVMLAGGAESSSCPLGMGGFSALRALSTRNDDPKRASRPWDKARDGFVMGDGAGVLVLESLAHAKARGARIYAELSGFGMSADAHHATLPEPEGLGAQLAMKNAIRNARLSPKDIHYVNAHATSTPPGDVVEALAIHAVFSNEALLVSSTKSMTGHLLGAAGAVEAIISVLTLRDQMVPPTINLDDPEITYLDLVPHHARRASLTHVLSNSFGFGGTNASLVFSACA